MALLGTLAAGQAAADLVFPSLSYRTGPYAANGIPFADGYADYFTLINERDGGVGGAMIKMIECETGYNTQKGVECYESTKGEGSLVYQPLSTGITYQLIPKATADGIPIHSMGYGRTSAAKGSIFEWVFNYPVNYWNGASVGVNHLLELNGNDIAGKKVALVYHNSAYGKEPIRTLEELSKKHGFDFMPIPVDHPGQEQKSQWLQIRRERPDYVLMWGWGVMNQVAIQEAANIRFPMENFIGIWWSGKMESLGLPNFGPEFTVSCENHGGPGLGAVQQWDASAKKWSMITEFGPSDMEVIGALIDEDAAAYAAESGIEARSCS